LAETNTPQSTDVIRGRLFYNVRVKRVFIADARFNERSDLRQLLVDVAMQVVGEAAGWRSVLTFGPTTHPDVVVVDWGLVSTRCVAAMRELRKAYPSAVLMIVPGHMDAHQRSKLIAGTDEFNDKGQLSSFWSNDLL
jgi:DNA-binding NarL/FixJ family response regulator